MIHEEPMVIADSTDALARLLLRILKLKLKVLLTKVLMVDLIVIWQIEMVYQLGRLEVRKYLIFPK